MRAETFYVVLVGFLCGVAANSFAALSFGATLWVSGAVLAVFVAVHVFIQAFFVQDTRYSSFVFLTVLFLLVASIGMARHAYTLRGFADDPLMHLIGEEMESRGLVISEPDMRETSVRFVVAAQDGKQYILMTVPLGSEAASVSYGDEVFFSGMLELPENFETDTGREFDYVSYLAKDGIGYQMYRPDIEIISHGNGNPIKRVLLQTKQSFIEHLQRAIPEPHSSLAAGILLGAKHSLGKELTEAFRQSGLVHIVVLSGYNVTIVADFIVKMFSFLPKYAGVAGGILGIVAFAIITGSGATVVRASVMACIALIGKTVGREYNIMRALSLAACVMVFHNPLILLSDPSFQLSCMATFALVSCSPFFEKHLHFLPEKFAIRATTASTLATQAFLLPLLIYMTGMVSIVALVTNLLVPLAVPTAMAVSFLSGLIGFVSNFLGTLIGYGAYMLLEYMLIIVRISSSVPYAYVNLPRISPWLVFLFYVVFAISYVRKAVRDTARVSGVDAFAPVQSTQPTPPSASLVPP